MTAELDRSAMDALTDFEVAFVAAEETEQKARVAKMRFIRRAIAAGWTFNRMGALLSQSGTGVRRWYERNHRSVRVAD